MTDFLQRFGLNGSGAFLAPWPEWLPWVGGLGFALLAFLLYSRETRNQHRGKFFLPFLRALTVLLVFLTLAQPVWRRTKDGGSRRCVVLVDRSASMGLTDAAMPLTEKIEVLGAMGQDIGDPLVVSLAEADALSQQFLTSIKSTLAELVPLDQNKRDRDLAMTRLEPLNDIAEKLNAPLVRVATSSEEGKTVHEEYYRKVYEELRNTTDRFRKHSPPSPTDEKHLLDSLLRHHQPVSEQVRALLAQAANHPQSSALDGLKEFDKTSRWRRALASLTGADGALASITEEADVEVWTFGDGDRAELVYTAERGDQGNDDQAVPEGLSAGVIPSGGTDISSALQHLVDGGDPPHAVVLVGDGGHIGSGSPQGLASALGDLGVPVHTLGLGATSMSGDVAIVALEAPQSVFIEDSVSGRISIIDTLNRQIRYRASVIDEATGEPVWTEEVDLGGATAGAREIPFQFPLKGLVEQAAEARPADKPASTAIQLVAKLEPLEDLALGDVLSPDRIRQNNTWKFGLQAETRKRQLVVLAGRARWEIRYLERLFRRQPGWDVTLIFADGGGVYPDKPGVIETADVVLIGDIEPDWFPAHAREELEKFVGEGAGGLLLLDGKRGNLMSTSGFSPGAAAALPNATLGSLSPVRWNSREGLTGEQRLRLSPEGAEQPALEISGTAEDDADTIDWINLPNIRWSAQVLPLPGSVILAESELLASQGAQAASPAITARRFGGGVVLHVGTDEIWRWRLGAGNAYQVQFWLQVIQWIGGEPFQNSGERVDIGLSRVLVQPGDPVSIRTRIRKPGGGFSEGAADVFARVTRPDGEVLGEFTLEPSGSGYRGLVPALSEAGDHQIDILSASLLGRGATADISASLRVHEESSGELARPAQRVSLLQSLSQRSGGTYLPEPRAADLADLVAGTLRRDVEIIETPLWSNWLWFLAIVLLLTIEWILRKKWGLV